MCVNHTVAYLKGLNAKSRGLLRFVHPWLLPKPLRAKPKHQTMSGVLGSEEQDHWTSGFKPADLAFSEHINDASIEA